MELAEDYKKVFCPFCKNKQSTDCEIRITIEGTPKCPFYELDKEKLKEHSKAKREKLKVIR